MKQISSSSHQKSEKFEDNNGIARNSSLKKDRQCNGKEKKKEKTITYSRHKIAGTKCWRGVKQQSLTHSFTGHKLELKQIVMW